MILSDKTIRKMLEEHSLSIAPWNPASVDIRLGGTFSIVEDSGSGMISMDRDISI